MENFSTLTDYGPVTVVYTQKGVGDLRSFIDSVNALVPHDGGDIPEYALDGMLAGLNATAVSPDTNEVVQLMRPGSQMVVLTDAPTKNEDLENMVIQQAKSQGVCVHFLLVDLVHNTEQFEIYTRIAQATSGTVQELDDFSFANFVASFRQNPCETLTTASTQRKRSTVYTMTNVFKRGAAIMPTYSQCKHIYISSFAYLLKLSIESTQFSDVSIFRPNGALAQMSTPYSRLVIFSEPMPDDGQWRICVNEGTLEIAVSQEIAFDTSVLFINEGSEMPSTTPPPLCEFNAHSFVSYI